MIIYSGNTEKMISLLLADSKFKQTEQEKEIYRLQNIEFKVSKEQTEKVNEEISKKIKIFWIVLDILKESNKQCYNILN